MFTPCNQQLRTVIHSNNKYRCSPEQVQLKYQVSRTIFLLRRFLDLDWPEDEIFNIRTNHWVHEPAIELVFATICC
jgi:hypothetical protein